MKSRPVPRCIMLPPLGRPRWLPQDSAKSELLYLSWGVRWMGDHPIPLAMHDGWVYAAILEGTPTLVLKDANRRTRPGEVFIFHPDCAFGWEDTPRRSSRIVTWLWRDAPAHSQLVPEAARFRQFKVPPQVLRQLACIHQHCLREVGSAGEIAQLALRRARLDLDICLAGALDEAAPAVHEARLNSAMHFLRDNPGIKNAVKALCEHLHVKPAALRALFQHHCRRSPQAVALDIRMHYAHQRLTRDHAPVKAVAFELGYRHPNDLSRAFKEYFGGPAREARRKPASNGS